MQRIVVGVDGSGGAADALRWAAGEARLHGASVTALLAWSLLAQPSEAFAADYGQDDAVAALDAWIDASGLSVEVTRSVECDLPAAALVRASASADLVVVGARGLGGFKALLLGSVSTSVAERALCPVAVVRDGGNEVGPVAVGVDGSSQARHALQWAVEEARARAVPLDVVHAWSGATAPAFGLPAVVPLSHAEEAAEDEVSAALERVDAGDLVVNRYVVEQSPAGALVDLSLRAGVVVVGSRGRGGLTSILLGSTSRKLLHHAHCPVVVVR